MNDAREVGCNRKTEPRSYHAYHSAHTRWRWKDSYYLTQCGARQSLPTPAQIHFVDDFEEKACSCRIRAPHATSCELSVFFVTCATSVCMLMRGCETMWHKWPTIVIMGVVNLTPICSRIYFCYLYKRISDNLYDIYIYTLQWASNFCILRQISRII